MQPWKQVNADKPNLLVIFRPNKKEATKKIELQTETETLTRKKQVNILDQSLQSNLKGQKRKNATKTVFAAQREGHKSCSNSETRQKIPRAKNIQKKHPNKVHENKKNRFSCLIVETQIDDDDDKSDLSLDELKLIKGKDRSESQKKGIIS